ncbi:MAG: C4-dicarboxylic acid transporter DauA [Pseudomonadota bacterium]
MFSALSESLKTERSLASIRSNILAGLTVGVIALPLSMALAIAVGVPPQHGLYTAMIAGSVIALTGGSQVNISGPTAAFVVVLLPIVHQYGLGGLLVSGFLAGIILVLMGLARFGRLIEVVPYPVIIGFTAGIGVVIATLQVKDFLGLDIPSLDGHFLDKLALIVRSLPTLAWRELLVSMVTLTILLLWPRLRTRFPGHLVALLAGSLVAWLLGRLGGDYSIATIGSRFHYDIAGIAGNGIPPLLPAFAWPWNLPGADGQPVGFSFALLNTLLGSAITIAMLGALESLLCAVVADGLSGKHHRPNDELIGQGLGNMVAALFGGIPATAAIARTAANVRAGGSSPLAAIVHGLFIFTAIIALAPLLAYIPMASLAALLLMVAWNMSEAKHFLRIIRIAPRDDTIALLTCFTLTIVFDMTIAVAVGMGLAAVLFIRRSISLTESRLVTSGYGHDIDLPAQIAVYDINGPLFFGSAQKAIRIVAAASPDIRVVILDMTEVTMLDMSAIVALESITEYLRKKGIGLVISNLLPRIILKLGRAGMRPAPGVLQYARDMREAAGMAMELLGRGSGHAKP